MMTQLKPRKLCFEENAIAHGRGKISTEEYIDNMLVHLTDIRHAQDTPLKRIDSDGLSMAIQSCLFEPKFKYLKDTTPIKSLLLSCWHDTLDLEFLAPKALSFLRPTGIGPKILLAMLTIACTRQDLSLLRYCFTLSSSINSSDDNEEEDDEVNDAIEAVFWAATTLPILLATSSHPDPIIWDVLLSYGLSRPSGQYWDVFAAGLRIVKVEGGNHQSRLENLAMIALKDPRRFDLLNVLLEHGLVVTNGLLSKAKAAVGNDMRIMKMLLKNLEDEDSEETETEEEENVKEAKASVAEVLIEKSDTVSLEKEKGRSKEERRHTDKDGKKKYSHSSDKKRDGDKKGSRKHKEKERVEHREHR